MFKQKLPKQDRGFTLVEVLVAILISTIFVAVSMQMMAIAAIFKVRAQEYAEATTWIQEDLENIKYQASNYQYTTLTAAANTDVLQVDSVDEFTVGDTLKVGTDSTGNTIADITGQTITLGVAIDTSWLTDTPVVAITRCPPGARNEGFADSLRDWTSDTDHGDGITDITDLSNPVNNPPSTDNAQVSGDPLESKVFTSKTYNLKRTTTLKNESPYNVLEIEYEVSPSSGGTPIAKFYTEVIPNAALQCP